MTLAKRIRQLEQLEQKRDWPLIVLQQDTDEPDDLFDDRVRAHLRATGWTGSQDDYPGCLYIIERGTDDE